MKLQGKSVAMFIANMYEDVEHLVPYYRMKEEGANVTVIGPNAEVYHGKHGVPTKADMSIREARAEEFDALLIPGGFSPDYMRRTEGMAEFVRTIHEQGKPIGTICHGPWMLASAGIAKNVKLTSFTSVKDDLKNAGANWVDEEVVVDKNIITSRYPGDLPVYCRTIVEQFAAAKATAPKTSATSAPRR